MTDGFWLDCARGTFAVLLLMLVVLGRGQRRITWLRDVARRRADERAPRVSIIAPALDEARGIEAAVRSFLAQDYPDLEVIVVDDRSRDATPAILARLAAELPRLRVLTIRELPAGWLGKNHANWVAARAASGEILLFTDADVVLAPGALDRAVAYLERERLDHLAGAPGVTLPGLWLRQFMLYFGLMFSLYVRPWAARDPRSRAHVGIGAFNLVRAEAYRRVGGHEPIRLRPDDDLKLGKLLKSRGCRQDFVAAQDLVSIEWYASWRELRDGLMKNLYAGVNYRTGLVVVGVLAHALGFGLPPLALFLSSGLAFWLNVANCAIFVLFGVLAARGLGTARWAGVLLPAFGLYGAWLMARSTFLALYRGGIDWRGTRYPLAELRRNVI